MSKTNRDNPLNIWNRNNRHFMMIGEGPKVVRLAKYVSKCCKWSYQRVTQGYCDADWWNMDNHLELLIPDMLEDLKNNRHGSPVLEEFLDGDKDANDIPYEDLEKKWNKVLDRIIFLFKEGNEETCTQKNPYEEEHTKVMKEFIDKYGLMGEKLMTKEELDEKSRTGMSVFHSMREIPEYRDIDKKWCQAEERLEKYRSDCIDEAIDMLKKYRTNLWD